MQTSLIDTRFFASYKCNCSQNTKQFSISILHEFVGESAIDRTAFDAICTHCSQFYSQNVVTRPVRNSADSKPLHNIIIYPAEVKTVSIVKATLHKLS